MRDEQEISSRALTTVVGINLGIVLAYNLYPLYNMMEANTSAGVGYFGIMAIIIFLHIVLLAIVAVAFLIAGRSQLAQACFLSLLLVAFIGPGMCLGVAAIVSKP